MKWLILNTDYPAFLRWFCAQHPELADLAYDEQMRLRNETLFSVADFYSGALRDLGHEAWDVHANNEITQKTWAREHGAGGARRRSWVAAVLPFVGRRLRQEPAHGWFHKIVAAQVKHYRPDVLLNQTMYDIRSDFIREVKPYARLVIGQHGAPPPEDQDLSCYDLIISAGPELVSHFRGLGLRSELNRLGFGRRVLDAVGNGQPADIPVSFIGTLSRMLHQRRHQLLEVLCTRHDVEIWGMIADDLDIGSLRRGRHHGPAWGREMYEILHRSRVTLNAHADFSRTMAGNMRLYEATGMGTLLLTDRQDGLRELFVEGKEIMTYGTPEECMEAIEYYLDHEEERQAIARAGQARTLREHTYHHRAAELMDIVTRHLRTC